MTSNANLFETDPTLGYADVVVDYYDSGSGPIDGPYGGTYNPSTLAGSYPEEVSLDVVLGDEPYEDDTVDFLSLPTDSYVTVAFVDEVVVDGEGDDIFITEIAGNGELADIYVRAGGGEFVYLGQASGGTTASFDLADIGFEGFVTEVKIVGLNQAGGSPGYDVVNVRALTAGLVDLSEDNDIQGTDQDDKIDLGDGDDTFEGGDGDDEAKGGQGDDEISGDDGDDDLSGNGGKDTLYGGNGKDTLNGGKKKDLLKGGKKNDDLSGGKGNDALYGQKGKDRLDGDQGNDTMVGGDKTDTFVFSEGDDLAKDFDALGDVDMVDLSNADGIDDLTDLEDNHMAQSGGDVVITDDAGDTLTLRDTDLNDLTGAHFLF